MATKIRRTLFIGLGGTGMNTLLHTKKMFYDTYGEVPPMIGFLGIDTDGGVYNKSCEANDGTRISLTTAEQLPISVKSPTDIYSRNPSNYDWLPVANVGSLTQLNIGAGAIRSNGRFAITRHKDTVVERINQKLQQINSADIIDNDKYALLSTDVEVHMVFSLGGGTGCGTFLNMAYLIRSLMPEAKLNGYAVTADVFRSMMQGASVVRVRPNAYGAIMDLDYLMHLDVRSTPVEIKWLRDVMKVNDRPFTAFYIVDNRNTNGDMFNNIDKLCEMISLALMTSTGELSVTAASVSDNVAKVIADGSMDICNKKAWAAGFGVSEIVFNGTGLAKIFRNKACIEIVNRMLNGGCDDPSMLANAWIDDVRIRENKGKDDVIDYFMTPTPKFEFTEIDNPDKPKPECDIYLNTRAVDSQEELNARLDELKARVRTSLRDFIKNILNRECGVYLASHVLGAIRTQVELCSGEMKNEIKERKDELPRLESAKETAIRELEACMGTLFKRGKSQYIEDVCESVRRLAVARREIKRREMAREFYTSFEGMLSELYGRIDTIAENLNAVRTRSTANIEVILQNIGNTSFFQFDLAIPESEKVTCTKDDANLHDFVEKHLKSRGGVDSIADMTTDETATILADYCSSLPKIKTYAYRSVEDVLDSMPEEELRRLVTRAIGKSLPLFTYNYHGYDAEVKTYPADTFIVGVANVKKSRLCKDGFFQDLVPGGAKADFSSTGLRDRIIIYRQVGVVPAFAITSLDSYKPEYERFERDKKHTSHWDDALCTRMERERFNLMPTSSVTEQALIEAWVMAVIFGLVSYSNGTYKIKSRGLGGRPLTGFNVDMGSTRKEALVFFEDNFDILKDELEAHIARLDVPGPDNQIRIRTAAAKKAAADGTYLETLSLCPIPMTEISLYPEEAELINTEIEYILDM